MRNKETDKHPLPGFDYAAFKVAQALPLFGRPADRRISE